MLWASLTSVNICNGVSDRVFLPYLGNCSKYYICMSGQPIEQHCNSGYHFDAKDQSCTYPDVAKCLPNCTNAPSAIVRECCDGLQYNAETDRCDFPQYVDCVDNMCSIFNDPNNITFLTSKAVCDKYFICMDGNAYAQNCSNGLQFNKSCNCCDFPKKCQVQYNCCCAQHHALFEDATQAR
ncbi:protein obstructor-E-like [Anastrepha obliqua]|uniref:protein obstructor-E-like n=1 Tax=Anastrepha obliqua TaxID=95512 RepID=UPI002409A4C6|nr:protein obstructor-E-like [Anastrepha obliqua]